MYVYRFDRRFKRMRFEHIFFNPECFGEGSQAVYAGLNGDYLVIFEFVENLCP